MDDFSPTGFVVSEYISGMNMGESNESLDITTAVFRTLDGKGKNRNGSYFNVLKNFKGDKVDQDIQLTHNNLEDKNANGDDVLYEEPSEDLAPPVPTRSPTIKINIDNDSETPPPVPMRHQRKPPTVPPRSPRCPSKGDLYQSDGKRNKSTSSSVSSVSSNDEEIVKVCCVTRVGDTLWAGRNLGDILIVNIGHENSYQYGEIITVLKVSPSAHLGNDVEVLLSTGTSIVSLSKSANNKKGEIISWEPYSAEDIRRIQNYWSLKKGSKTTVADIGSF